MLLPSFLSRPSKAFQGNESQSVRPGQGRSLSQKRLPALRRCRCSSATTFRLVAGIGGLQTPVHLPSGRTVAESMHGRHWWRHRGFRLRKSRVQAHGRGKAGRAPTVAGL